MPCRYSVRVDSFYHTVKNEPRAHRGDEKTDDPGRGVYPSGADPAHHFFGRGETGPSVAQGQKIAVELNR